MWFLFKNNIHIIICDKKAISMYLHTSNYHSTCLNYHFISQLYCDLFNYIGIDQYMYSDLLFISHNIYLPLKKCTLLLVRKKHYLCTYLQTCNNHSIFVNYQFVSQLHPVVPFKVNIQRYLFVIHHLYHRICI